VGGAVFGLLAAWVAGTTVAAAAAVPPGPRLAVTSFSFERPRFELLSVDPGGAALLRLAGGGRKARPLPQPYSAPSWSPDGELIAFSAYPHGIRSGKELPTIFLAGADGGSSRAVPGTRGGFSPVFAPDGRTIAFARQRRRERRGRHGRTEITFEGVTTWTADIERGKARRLTPWRNGLKQFPSSFSPDGLTLAMTRADESRSAKPQAVLMHRGNRRIELLAESAGNPTFSPDGSEIALLRRRDRRLPGRRRDNVEETTDVYVLRSGGIGLRRVTRTPGVREVSVSWDPSGERLALTRFRGGNSEAAFLGIGGSIVQTNSDGTCPTRVLRVRHAALYGATWQPGPGREAGRIAC